MTQQGTSFLAALARLLDFLLRFWKAQRRRSEFCACPPALRKPDPFLHSQRFLMSLGLPVTWDNPDIFIFDGATPVDPHNLRAAARYTLVARIWNSSTDIPVLDLPVIFSYLSFGMGVQSHPIDQTSVNLNVKGLPGCPAFAAVQWTTPTTVGHYCLQVWLEPPDDSNWVNNLGQRNTDVTHAASAAEFTFDVGNHVGPRPRRVHFTVDTYVIPPLPRCDDRRGVAAHLQRIHMPGPAVPEGWRFDLEPSSLTLAPGEERTIRASVTPPDGFSGSMPFNVTALDDIGPFGGVTVTVDVR